MNLRSFDLRRLKWKIRFFISGESLRTFHYRLFSHWNYQAKTRDIDAHMTTKLTKSPLDTKDIYEYEIEISHGTI